LEQATPARLLRFDAQRFGTLFYFAALSNTTGYGSSLAKVLL
jgi:hypothetical protein